MVEIALQHYARGLRNIDRRDDLELDLRPPSRHPGPDSLSRGINRELIPEDSTPTMIHGVIFDMDGLLIDTEPIWRRVEIEVFGGVGLHLTENQLLETMGVRVAEVVGLWHERHPWTDRSVDEVTQDIVDGVIDHVMTEGEPNPGVCEALTMVHHLGLPIAIASSSSEKLIRAVVERLDIGRYIQAMCSADDEPFGKPDPSVYLTAARRLGVPPRECLALEDSPNGVLSAKAAGMYCIAVPDPHLASDPRLERADLRLRSLEDFTPEVLAELSNGAAVR